MNIIEDLQITDIPSLLQVTNHYIFIITNHQILYQYELQNFRLINQFQCYNDIPKCLSYCEISSYLAIGGYGNNFKIWKLYQTKEIELIYDEDPQHFNCITNLLFFNNGQQIISCSLDETIIIWHIQPNYIIKQINNTGKLTKSILTQCEQFLITISFDGIITLYHMTNNQKKQYSYQVFEQIEEFYPAFSLMKNKQIMITFDKRVTLYWFQKRKIIKKLKQPQNYTEYLDGVFMKNDQQVLIKNPFNIVIYDLLKGRLELEQEKCCSFSYCDLNNCCVLGYYNNSIKIIKNM